MCYIIGLDIGTSSVKGVLMKDTGEIEKTAHKFFEYERTENGKVQIDSEIFVNICYSAINELAKDRDIAGICAASASGNVLILDKNNRPITPITSWQDKRVTNEAKEVLGEYNNDKLYDLIGWPFSGRALPLAQLCYIKKHNPALLKNCGMVCMSTEYLYYTLTGEWGISASAGTPFCLIDQEKERYITELLEKINIDETVLPPIMPCGTVLGVITEESSKLCGAKAGTPLILGTFDHPSAARGAGVLKEGDMLLSLGTSWVAFLPVESRDVAYKAKTLIDPFLAPKGAWGAMVSVSSISERVKLYLNRYIDSSPQAYKVLDDLAAKSDKGENNLYIFLYDEPDDEVVLKYSKPDIARAIMEGTVRLLKNKIDALKESGITANCAKVVGGPSEGDMWIRIIEEMLDIPVSVVHGAVTGAVGAAVIAGIGVGIYKDELQAIDIIKTK